MLLALAQMVSIGELYRHRGYGGQFIMVFQDLDLVVVATSATTVSDERRELRRQLCALIERQVLAPLRVTAAQR